MRVGSAAVSTAAISQLVYVLITLPSVPSFSIAYAVGHLTYLLAIQLGHALALGFVGNGRAWAAASFALLGAATLAFLAVASRSRGLHGAPIVAGALGSAYGCWIVAWRYSRIPQPEAAAQPVVLAAVMAIGVALFFASLRMPERMALPRAMHSLLLALAAVGSGFGAVSLKKLPVVEIGPPSSPS